MQDRKNQKSIRQSIWRTRVRRLIITSIVLGGIGFILSTLADNPFTQRIVRIAINEKINNLTDFRIDYRALKVSIFMPGVDLYGANISHKSAPGQPLLTSNQLRVRISMTAMLLGEFKLSLVELTDLDINYPPPVAIEKLFAKTQKAPAVKTQMSWPPKFELPVESIRLINANATAIISDSSVLPPTSTHIAIRGIDLDLNIAGWNNIDSNLQIASLLVSDHRRQYMGQTKVDLKARLRGRIFLIDRLAVETPDIKLSTNGRGQVGTEDEILNFINLSLKGNANGDLAILGRLLEIDETDGKIDADLTVTSKIDFITPANSKSLAKASVVSDGARIGGFNLHQIKTDLTFDGEKLNFANADIIIDNTNYGEARGSINIDDELAFSFTALPSRLPLSKLLSVFNVDQKAVDFELSSNALLVKGKGFPFLLNVGGNTNLEKIHILPKNLPTKSDSELPQCIGKLSLNVDQSKLSINRSQLNCGHSRNIGSTQLNPLNSANEPSRAASLIIEGKIFFDEVEGLNLNLSTNNFPVELFAPNFDVNISGASAINASIKGPYNAVKVFLDASVVDTIVGGVPFGFLNATTIIDENSIKISSLRSEPPAGGQLQLSDSSINLDEKRSYIANFRATQITKPVIFSVFRLIDQKTTMGFDLSELAGKLEGSFSSPLRSVGQLDFTLKNLSYDGEVLADKVSANVVGKKSGWETTNLQLDRAGFQPTLKIVHRHSETTPKAGDPLEKLGMSLDDPIEIQIKTETSPNSPEPQNHLGSLAFIGNGMNENGIKGTLAMSGKFAGTLRLLQGNFNIKATNLTALDCEIAPITVEGFIADSTLDLIFNHSGNALQGRFSMKTHSPYTYRLFASANRTDIRAFATKFFFDDPRNYGYLTGSATMTGPVNDFWKSTGKIQLDDIKFKYIYDLKNTQKNLFASLKEPTTIALSSKGWNIVGDKPLTISGDLIDATLSTVKNTPPSNLSLEVTTRASLEVLPFFIPQVETASGIVEAKINISGKISDPKVKAKISTVNDPDKNVTTSLGIADFRPPLTEVELSASFEDDTLTIQQITAKKGKGSVSGNGRFSLSADAAQSSRFDITMRNATVIYPVPVLHTFETEVDGNVTITGSGFPFQIAADVNILKARSIGDFDIRKKIFALQRRTFASVISERKPMLELDIQIKADNNILITNRNIQTTMSANLAITGTDQKPVLSGTIEIDRGKFIYRRDFTINQGIITFDDPIKLDPKLDITAYADVSNYRVIVIMTGRASEPVIDLTIDPPTRDDGSPISKLAIISLLSSGSLPSSSGNLFATNVARDEAANIFAGQLEELTENFLDLSGQSVVRQIYIDAVPNKEGTPEARVNMPLNLGENWDMVLRVQPDNWNVSYEYSVHENVSLLGSFDGQEEGINGPSNSKPATDTGVDLKFRFAFP